MSNNTDKMNSRNKIESIVIIIFFVLLFGILVNISVSTPVHRWGDTSTYYLQIVSITEDHDIQYQPVDIQRALLNKFDNLPSGLLLIKTDDGRYFYGKEFSYALFASPFFGMFGNSGILFFNALMFWIMVLMGFFYLSKKGNSPILSFFTSLLFFILSTAVVYIFWIHAEIYNMFLITAGIFFWLLYIEDQNKDKYLLIAAIIFGLATVAKLPNCLLFLPFLCYELYHRQFKRQFKRVILILLIFLIPIILFYGYFYLETGSMSFYGGNRLVYLNHFPFIGGFDNISESGLPAFSVDEGLLSALISPDVLTKSPVNLFYYFFGRFTGMIWYYPLTAFALLSFVLGLVYIKKQNDENFHILSQIRKNPAQSLILMGIILNILFYFIIIGNNYLGGQHAVGNRYFYIFPAFLFLIGKIDPKVIIPFIIIALFTVIPIISDPVTISSIPGKNTFEFPYTLFPIEYSQINNIPLYSHQYVSSKYAIYDIDGKGIFSSDQNFIIMNGTSSWLIKTKTKNQTLSLMFITPDMSKKQVIITSESQLTDIIIDDMNTETINIPLSKAVYENAEYQIYYLKFESSPDVFIIPLNEKWKKTDILFLTGWYGKENWQGVNTRWTSGNATFMYFSDNPQNKTLNLGALSYRSPKNLTILFQNDIIANNYIYTHKTQIQVPISLQKGINIFRLFVPETCKRPPDSPELTSNDTRCLSIAIQNVTIN